MLHKWCCSGKPANVKVVKDDKAAAYSRADLELLQGENFILRAIIPAQQGKVVDHGLRQVTLMPELPYTGGPMPLAQLALVRGKNEADMAELGLLEAQRVVDQHLSRQLANWSSPSMHMSKSPSMHMSNEQSSQTAPQPCLGGPLITAQDKAIACWQSA